MHKQISPLLLFVIFLIFSVACFIIVGWIHPDEHYQILEFANYKRGLVGAENLSWEFTDRIRPTIQPAIAYLILNILSVLSVKDPFIQALILRLFSAAFFIFCSVRLYQSLQNDFKSQFFKYLYFGATFFLYVFPLAGSRFSSENWSACFYMLGFACLYPYVKKDAPVIITAQNAWISGALLGFSFLIRYQSAIMIVGLACWLLIFNLKQIKFWLIMLSGFVVVFLLGILIDYWFYGEWAITAWNYFYVNLVEGKAATFGTEPWWWYLSQLFFSKSMILLNGSVLALLLLFALVKFKHPFTWIFFPFLIIHFLIGHKETRFLFPILVFIPFMVTASLQFIDSHLKSRKLLYLGLIPLLIINGFAFAATALHPYDNSSEIYKFVRTLPRQPIVIYFESDSFYYTLTDSPHNLTPNFYKDGHKIVSRPKVADFVASMDGKAAGKDTLSYAILTPQEQEQLNGRLKPVFSAQPEFIESLNYRNWMRSGFAGWKLYRLD